MAQNKTIGELREIAKDLTNEDMQTLVALYGLTVAQDVAVEMFESETPGDLMGDTYPGTALVDEAVDFVTDLITAEAIYEAINGNRLPSLFNIELDVQTKTIVIATRA